MNSTEFTPEFFDISSKAWMENKIKSDGMYYYRCNYIHSNGKRCIKQVVRNQELCKCHFILKITSKR